MRRYTATGKYIDRRESFKTLKEAEQQIKEWIAEDIAEGFTDTENDYYIMEDEFTC